MDDLEFCSRIWFDFVANCYLVLLINSQIFFFDNGILDNKDWRGHVEQIKLYKATIGDSMQSVKSQLDKLTNNISETMDKITSREKFLNSNLDSLLMEYRSVQVGASGTYFLENLSFYSLIQNCQFSSTHRSSFRKLMADIVN